MELEKATLFRADRLDNLMVLKAQYQRFQFSRHSHEDFALGLMDKGVQQIYCRGEYHHADCKALITVNPDEIHDGKSADEKAFCYRILFIPCEVIQGIGLALTDKKINHYYRSTVTNDPELVVLLRNLFSLLEQAQTEDLELQSTFYNLIASLLGRHGTEFTSMADCVPIPATIEKARAFIMDMAQENISLDQMAAVAGLSRYHFLRVFKAALGMSPHEFLLHRRLHLALEALKKGSSIVDAALDAGFVDQSHLSRRFKAAFGITPKQFQRAI